MRKKLLSVLLSFVLVLSLAPTVAHAMSFPDVPEDSDYAVAIEYISELKIMVGDTQGNFNPDKIVSRAEMATIICRMLGKTENLTTSNVFTDVPINHWANAYIGQAAALGIVGGYGNGKFGPGDPVTFEQAVTMVIRATGQEDSAIALGGYPTGYLMVAEANGLLKEIQAVQGQGLIRSSVAMLLYNYYQNNPGTSSNVGEHTHNYVTQVKEYTEERQVGTKTVNDYAQVTIYGCNSCNFTSYNYDDVIKHTDPRFEESKKANGGHMGSSTWSKTTTEVVGTHEEPVYSTRTVSELVRVCSICGAQE